MDEIFKLQPHRTMHLQGFNDFGAAAALHSASDSGFTVSGVFRDMADFAVLVLFDNDDFYGHPRFSYLPDGDFGGITLQFDLKYTNLQPIDSPKFATIDWPYLNIRRQNGALSQIRLVDSATFIGGSLTFAWTEFTLVDAGIQPFDRVSLWYENLAFDYTVPGSFEAEYPFFAQGEGYTHEIVVDGVRYSHTEGPGEGSGDVANAMVAEVTGDPNVDVMIGSAAHTVRLVRKGSDGTSFLVTSTWGGSATLWRVTATTVVNKIAQQINDADYSLIGLTVAVFGLTIQIGADRSGWDGNMIRMYATSRTASLYFTPDVGVFAGGNADATWRVTIPLSGFSDISKMWMTFAPKLPYQMTYIPEEWTAVFTNWTVTDSLGKRKLRVAGPHSVRLEEDDRWAKYVGYWEPAPENFWSGGRAVRAAATDATVTIETHCGQTHDIYVGTRLDYDTGIIEARLDGGSPVYIDCWAWGASSLESQGNARQVRRKLFSGVSAGQHEVVIRLTGTKNPNSQGFYFYYDFLECAVLSDVPDAAVTRPDVGVACDYGTDHTYKLSPQRLVWAIKKLGFVAPIDHYVSVFWWNQRKRKGGTLPQLTVTFGGTWSEADSISLTFGPSSIPLGKYCFDTDTSQTIAAHFAYFINENYVGLWATAAGSTLTVKVHSAAPNFGVPFTMSVSSSGGTASDSGWSSLLGGELSEWVIDDAGTAMNRAASDWHRDYFKELAANSMSCVVAYSQELVLPPDAPGHVWIQRYPDGEPVLTATGFSNKASAHCAFAPEFRAYITKAYREAAALMQAAGLPIKLQFGEVLWWFFKNPSGMAFYDDHTKAQFLLAHGRPMEVFTDSFDDPSVNGYVDADFLRETLRDHVATISGSVLASYPSAQFEILWPLDVNYPDTHPLLHYINLPDEWKQKAGSGLDSFLVEGFQFAGIERNLEKVSRCAAYPFKELNWPREDVGYLMGIFNGGWPWEKDFLRGQRTLVPVMKMWAYDHLCLYARGLPLPEESRYSIQT